MANSAIKRGTIDQRAVIDAATVVARRVGLDGLTMRMVADELGVSAMAAYRHVPNRESLVSLVADELGAMVEVPDPASGTWDERLRALQVSAFAGRSTVSGSDVASVQLMLQGQHTRRIVRGMMDILVDAGFDDDDAALAFEVVWAYFVGQLNAYEVIVAPRMNHPDQPGDELWPILGRAADGMPVSPEEYFERGFDILLDGLRARLARKVGVTASS